MGTGVCLFLHWENEIWVTGTGNHERKLGNGKHVCQERIKTVHCTAYVVNAQ